MLPKNFTLLGPGPGYTCGPANIVPSTIYLTPDDRRKTQAMSMSTSLLLSFFFCFSYCIMKDVVSIKLAKCHRCFSRIQMPVFMLPALCFTLGNILGAIIILFFFKKK